MDRKTMIASLDILSKKFAAADDPIATDLRTMAHCFSKMKDDEFSTRMAKEEAVEKEETVSEKELKDEAADKTANAWMDHMKKVREENPGKSLKELIGIAKKTYKKEATEEEVNQAMEMLASEERVSDNWTKEASDAVLKALVADVTGTILTAGKKKPGKPDGTGPFGGTPECPMSNEDKVEKVEDKAAADAIPVVKEEKADKTKKVEDKAPADAPVVEEKADKAAEVKVEDKTAAKKTEEKADKAAEVNTDILAHEKFDGIELTSGMIASDDVGELSTDEKSRLDLLFQR